MMQSDTLLSAHLKTTDTKLSAIIKKILSDERISREEGLVLFERADLGLLAVLSSHVRHIKNENFVFFNRNLHIEPTNICVFNCKFCSYSRKKGEHGAWESNLEDIIKKLHHYEDSKLTEVHIVGGVHPDKDIFYYAQLLEKIQKARPGIHIKAFTAVEIDYMTKKAGISIEQGLSILKNHGLNSMPGGGAEIFDEKVRSRICGEKSNEKMWLEIHEKAHRSGIPSNATMLYGHVEKYIHRLDHLNKLRQLQDKTHGFNTFIPLKYRSANNSMEKIGEVPLIEDLKNYAISRIFLDNFPHIKAYWPMIGKNTAQLSLSFGVDDLDGTIDDSTKIYSMAGAEDKNPGMHSDDLANLIKQAGFIAAERDTLYNILKVY
jgi:aminodeoxyfutalosine synthase